MPPINCSLLNQLIVEFEDKNTNADKNIKSVRPGFGKHPKYYSKILGKEAKKNFKKGERVE